MYQLFLQDVNSLEPTLQAALLKRSTWQLFERVAVMYSKCELKGMDPKKRNRSSKEREVKQHQVIQCLFRKVRRPFHLQRQQ